MSSLGFGKCLEWDTDVASKRDRKSLLLGMILEVIEHLNLIIAFAEFLLRFLLLLNSLFSQAQPTWQKQQMA